MGQDTLILHEYSASGNCYKVRLTAALLGLPLERREYDIMKGETRTPDFLANVNANGRIPVLQVGDRFIPESNAACFYLADGSPLIPDDRFERADMLRWMFWEQYNHEPNVATLRFWIAFVGEEQSERGAARPDPGQARGRRSGAEADGRASDPPAFFVGERLTLADIALYAYTHVAAKAASRCPTIPPWRRGWRGSPRSPAISPSEP